MTSVQGIKQGIVNGFNTVKTKAANAYKNVALGTVIAGEHLKGLAMDTVQFAKAKPVKAGVIGLGIAAGVGAAAKLVSIGVSKFKEHKEEKKLEAAINQRNAVIAAMAEPALAQAKQVIEDGVQVVKAQQAEIDRLQELVQTHEIVHEADQEALDAYHEALAGENSEVEAQNA